MRGLILLSTIFLFLLLNGPVRSEESADSQSQDDSSDQNNQEDEEDLDLYIDPNELAGQSDGTQGEAAPVQINTEPPRFLDFPRNTQVEENSIQFNPQIEVTAEDPEGTMITYKIVSGDTSNAFIIHPTLGTLQLNRPLTYQSTPLGRGRFNLTISATDSGVPKRTQTTMVSVLIIDRNDNPPVFTSTRYIANITELTTPGIGIRTVRANDIDSGLNKEIRYELVGSNQFIIDPMSGVVSISRNANLDIDTNGNTYYLTVLAKDQGRPQLTGSAMLTIYVSDANNHPPMFAQNRYLATVAEGSSVGTTVTTVKAYDTDANAVINYEIISADPSYLQSAFAINRMAGDITTQRIMQMENRDEITLVIRAMDINAENPTPQTATATVRVLLQNAEGIVKFSPPWTATNPVINIEIPEDTPVGTSVFTLRATDNADVSSIQFFSEPGSDINNYFSVQQSTGIVTLNRALDYDTMMMPKQVQFQVGARTTSFPFRSAVATMIFKVTDVNDNSPMFLQQSYAFRTSESVRFPQEIGTVKARDGDSGVHGQIYYTLSGDGSDKFYLDRISGKLVVASSQTLDADERRVYDLIVTAMDSATDGNSKSATASVRIELDDVNDNAPQFSRRTYTTYTKKKKVPTATLR